MLASRHVTLSAILLLIPISIRFKTSSEDVINVFMCCSINNIIPSKPL